MTNIDIDDKIYKQWVKFYEKADKLEYPNMKNFTAKKLLELMKDDRN
jgi:hypothetical protein